MSTATAADLLRALADDRDFRKAVGRFPGLSDEAAVEMLRRAAGALVEKPKQAVLPFTAPVKKLRVYADGAARGNPGPAGAGAVLVGPDGHVVEELGRFLGEQTNNVAEYQGLILGLRRAQELGAEEVEILGDSLLVVKQISGKFKVKNAGLKPLHEEAVRLLRGFKRWSARHIPREQNALADEMSNRAIDERM